jgi:Tfp pilus assembly protein FimV
MRVQEAEARHRAEQMAQLEAQRLQHEMEIRRREVEKKRPTWLLITVGVDPGRWPRSSRSCCSCAAIRGDNAAKDKQKRAAEAAAEVDRKKAAQAENERRELARQLDELNSTVEALNKEMAAADQALAAASTKADRDRVAGQQAEIRRKQAEAQARINKVRAGVKLKCPPDQPLC